MAAFGRQNVMWGAIDGIIAGAGIARRRPDGPEHAAALRRTLMLNAALDVAYISAGAALIASRHRLASRSPRYSGAQAIGDGAAIILQGGFLLILDSTNARRLAS